MIESLISLLVLIIILGIVLYLILWLIDLLPMEPNFKQFAKVVLILICVLVLLLRALPLIGVHL